MSGKRGPDDLPDPSDDPSPDTEAPDHAASIVQIIAALSIESLMEEAGETPRPVADETEEPQPIAVSEPDDESGDSAVQEDVVQAGPAGDDVFQEIEPVAGEEPGPSQDPGEETAGSIDGDGDTDEPAAPAEAEADLDAREQVEADSVPDEPSPAVPRPPTTEAAAIPVVDEAAETDRRFMAAAIRMSRRHLGLTSTNPSVGTLIVRDGRIIGRGVTAIGGRPHAETQALAEAGTAARGATAYVTLEPCAHHGRTPPCAEALVAAGIARVVGAAADPDDRVSGRGYAILRAAGIEVVEGVMAREAADLMAGYLTRSSSKRPEVTLKLALSADDMIGRRGAGQVPITGGIARAQVHLMRAEADAILVGVGTVEEDDPELGVRLPGLEARSPIRIVLDRQARLPMMSKLALSARSLPLYVAVGPEASPVRRSSLEMLGVQFLATEMHEGRIALPELLEDLAARGVSTVLVEGGAATARMFLRDGVVDRIALFRGTTAIGAGGIAAPVTPETIPEGFRLVREARYGVDRYWEWVKD